MTNPSPIDQLNEAIDVLLASPRTPSTLDEPLGGLLEMARELRYLPRAEFKTSLEFELREQAAAIAAATAQLFLVAPASDDGTDFPTLLGTGYGNYPVHAKSFAASFLLHAAAAVLLVSSGVWLAQHRAQLEAPVVTLLTDPGQYPLPVAPDEARGGGGGGDKDHLNASQGTPPRFADQQMTPPAIVIRNPEPKLAAQPTVIGPPQLKFPVGPTGVPLAALAPPSNGPGTGGGMGSGTGGGVGSGTGTGVGPGIGGGIGGGVYTVGGGVSAPRAIYDPDPDYSEEARKARYQGTVVLWAVIGPEGRAKELRVTQSLGMGLDEKAIEAVRKWRFEPALKDGRPVAVQVSIEVRFRLY